LFSVKSVWNSGLWASVRGGCSASTTCSNGMSWFAKASSVVRRTCCSSCATSAASPTRMRIASVLMKKPISGSSSARWRLATETPITRSAWSASRESSSDQPASSVMNGVVPWRRERPRTPSASAAGSATWTLAPR
jgi:hypothetical protein